MIPFYMIMGENSIYNIQENPSAISTDNRDLASFEMPNLKAQGEGDEYHS
jgi:hypothetical protein